MSQITEGAVDVVASQVSCGGGSSREFCVRYSVLFTSRKYSVDDTESTHKRIEMFVRGSDAAEITHQAEHQDRPPDQVATAAQTP
jgi:hypothetical protein